MATFAVFSTDSAGWVADRGVREQPYWDEHAAFIDHLFDEGRILLGGPYADGGGALLIVEMDTDSPAQVRAAFEADPWVTHDIRVVSDVKRWQIFVDARNRQVAAS